MDPEAALPPPRDGIDDGATGPASILASDAPRTLPHGLTRAMREHDDPDLIMAAASEAVGQRLQANGAGFVDVDSSDTVTFSVGWTDGVLPVPTGSFSAVRLGADCLAAMRANEVVVIADVQRDPRTRDVAPADLEVRACIVAPIVRSGDWRAGFYVTDASVREWTADELALVREIADQTWDAVERAQAMLALRVSEARSRAVFNATSDAIAISDREGTVLYANLAYLEFYGYAADDVIGHNFAIIFPESDRAWAAEQHRAIFEQQAPLPVFESRVRRQDGTERFVEVKADFVVEDGQRTALISAIRDVTARHEADAALRASEERLRLALDATGMGVFAWDPATGRADADPALQAMLGLESGENILISEVLERHMLAEEVERYREAMQAMLDPTGSGRLSEEVRWTDADGDERWLAFAGEAFFAGDGVQRRAVRAIGTVMDITPRKQIELERAAFVASAAHDLNTPLTSIMGRTQLLLRRVRAGTADPARVESSLADIEAAAQRMKRLIEEVMDVARLDAGQALELHLTPTDLVALVERVVRETPMDTANHRMLVECEEPSITGVWDGERLSRVVENLLTNAVKFSPRGGQIAVHIGREGSGSAASAVLTVTDHGVGIPERELPKIFERFRRGANVRHRIKGTGIGLSGAARVVEQHGGTMQVESREGEGSTFTVTLPLEMPQESVSAS